MSERPKMVNPKPLLTPHLKTPKDIATANNNNNNNKHDNVYGAVIMAEPLREFTRFI